MTTEKNNLPQFEAIRDSDEEILWTGKPVLIPFVLTGVPFLIFGLFWGFIVFGMFSAFSQDPMFAGMSGVKNVFYVFFSIPFWASVLNMIRLFLVHGNTLYAYTNKRLMMRSGFWGTDFKAIDYDRIADLTVNVGPIDNLFGVGTISAFSGRTTTKGVQIYDRFWVISNPYEVFKKIKELSVDVKTDWNYPNALRPEANPGYRTKYEPNGK